MNEGDLASGLLKCASWMVTLLHLALGIIALVRLKTTPSGLLLGGGFISWALVGGCLRVVRMVMRESESADFSTLMLLGATGSCGTMFFLVIIAVGFVMLPRSLAKLGGAPVKLGPREG